MNVSDESLKYLEKWAVTHKVEYPVTVEQILGCIAEIKLYRAAIRELWSIIMVIPNISEQTEKVLAEFRLQNN